MAVSVKRFVERLVESGLMTSEDVSAFVQSLPTRPADGRQLAEVLIRKNKLTAYQAQRIYQGRHTGLVLGNYQILESIGAGGMGEVYLAEHRRMGRRVALKTLPETVANDDVALQRFHREVRAAARLAHANIVTAFDADESDGVHFYVMEFVEGTDLSRLVKRQGRLPLQQAVDYTLQAAEGLEYAHRQGVVHRDVKPGNLLVSKDNVVKILDMGLARVEASHDEIPVTDLTATGTLMGTIDYMAPEQAADTRQADARSDIYSLGCVLYYLATGRSLYEEDTVVKKILAHREAPIPSLTAEPGDFTDDVRAVFERMVAKEPEERYQTMSEVIADLQRCSAAVARQTVAQPGEKPSHEADMQSFLESLDDVKTASLQRGSPSADESATVDTVPSGVLHETHFSESRPSPSPPSIGKSGRDSGRWILAAGIIGPILIAGVIIITIRNKDGSTTTIEAKDAVSVEVENEHGQVLGKVPATSPDTVSVPEEPTPPPPAQPTNGNATPLSQVVRQVNALGGAVLTWNSETRQHDALELDSPYPKEEDFGLTIQLGNRVLVGNNEVAEIARSCRAITGEHSISFDLSGTSINAEGLHQLKGLRLHTLNINRNPQVDDRLAEVLPAFSDLCILGLQETSVTDKTIASLPILKSLETLNLGDTRITPECLPALAQLLALRSLDVSRTPLDGGLLEEIHEKIPQCQITWSNGVIEPVESASQD